MSSQLRQFEDTLLNIQETSELKGSFKSFVSSTSIRDLDKRKLLMNIDQCNSLERLHKLFYNSLLKFEGQGVLV